MNEYNIESSAISRGCFAYKGKRKHLKLENYLDSSTDSRDAAADQNLDFARGKWLKARVNSLQSLLKRLSTEGESKLKKEMHSKLFDAVCEFVVGQASRLKADEFDAGGCMAVRFRARRSYSEFGYQMNSSPNKTPSNN